LLQDNFSTDTYGGNSMPIIKLDIRRELVSLELHYGSYENDEGPPWDWSPGCGAFNPCWCENVCLVFSVSSKAPIVRHIAEVHESFITIDQLQHVSFQRKKTSKFVILQHQFVF
jgi:hypothetical protein